MSCILNFATLYKKITAGSQSLSFRVSWGLFTSIVGTLRNSDGSIFLFLSGVLMILRKKVKITERMKFV